MIFKTNQISNGVNKKLKIGILLASFEVPAWEFAMVEKIANSNYAEISLIVLDGREARESIFEKSRKKWHRLIYYIYDKIDQRIFRGNPDAFVKKDLKTLLPDTKVIKVKPVKRKNSDFFSEGDIDEIKKHQIDILVRMGFGILRGDILHAAKYGIWSYHHADNLVNRGGPPGYWETVEGWEETGSILQILDENLDGGKVIFRSWSATDPISPTRNRNNYYWKSLSFLPRKIEELYNLGEEKFFAKASRLNKDIDFYSHRLYKTPDNLKALKMTFKQMFKILYSRIYQRVFYLNQWFLMYCFKDDMSSLSFRKFNKIIPPKDRFWADPFVVHRHGKYYIFIEEFIYSTAKGHISVIEMDEKGNHSNPVTVLEKDNHLSYPFILEFEDKIYMIPDTGENRTIELYECLDFPYGWKHKQDLMKNINAVDATLFYHHDKWWLFAAVAENKGSSHNDELFLFYADIPFADNWQSHPLNPIISDVKRARPAGRIFCHQGKIYRPSQDCSKDYGQGLNINEITILTETDYEEKLTTKIKPCWDKRIKGMHSFIYENNLVMVDALMKRPKFF